MARSKKDSEIIVEQKNQELVEMQITTKRKHGETEAFKVAELMKAYNQINTELLETVKYSGMNPGQLLADGFRELAKNNGKIGQLNITPDIIQALSSVGDTIQLRKK